MKTTFSIYNTYQKGAFHWFGSLLGGQTNLITDPNGVADGNDRTKEWKTAMGNASDNIESQYTTVVDFMYSLCAILLVIGAIRVVQKFSRGEPDVTQAVTAWGSAVVFAALVATILNEVFVEK